MVQFWWTVTQSRSLHPLGGGGSTNSSTFKVRTGDINADGLLDVAITADSPSTASIDDVLLLNIGSGELQVLTNPYSYQLSLARYWAASSTAKALVADVSLDRKDDIVLTGLDSVVAGASSTYMIWSNDGNTAFPTTVLKLGAEQRAFFSDFVSGLSDLSHFANATTAHCFTTGFWVNNFFIGAPGWYTDANFAPFYVDFPGHYYARFYFASYECLDILNPNISPDAYNANLAVSLLAIPNITDAEFKINTGWLYDILESLFNMKIGQPADRPPVMTKDKAVRILQDIWFVISAICHGSSDQSCTGQVSQTVEDELVKLAGTASTCFKKWAAGQVPYTSSNNPFLADSVPHASGQNFAITAYQNTLSNQISDTSRLNFWTSRLSNSRDPLGPLAIDTVNNAFSLGCLANERLKVYQSAYARSETLTQVGSRIMVFHRNAVNSDITGLNHKLSAQQVAQYHFQAFGTYNLPPKTFGGTPLSGNATEAKFTKYIWCPSCENN